MSCDARSKQHLFSRGPGFRSVDHCRDYTQLPATRWIRCIGCLDRKPIIEQCTFTTALQPLKLGNVSEIIKISCAL